MRMCVGRRGCACVWEREWEVMQAALWQRIQTLCILLVKSILAWVRVESGVYACFKKIENRIQCSLCNTQPDDFGGSVWPWTLECCLSSIRHLQPMLPSKWKGTLANSHRLRKKERQTPHASPGETHGRNHLLAPSLRVGRGGGGGKGWVKRGMWCIHGPRSVTSSLKSSSASSRLLYYFVKFHCSPESRHGSGVKNKIQFNVVHPGPVAML